MAKMKKYSDDVVEFSYPAGFHLQACTKSGQYVLGQGKKQYFLMSIVPREWGDVFEQKAQYPSPEPDREKLTICRNYVLGGKRGRAILAEIVDPTGKIIGKGVEFFIEKGAWSAKISLNATPPTDFSDMEQIVATLQIKSGKSEHESRAGR